VAERPDRGITGGDPQTEIAERLRTDRLEGLCADLRDALVLPRRPNALRGVGDVEWRTQVVPRRSGEGLPWSRIDLQHSVGCDPYGAAARCDSTGARPPGRERVLVDRAAPYVDPHELVVVPRHHPDIRAADSDPLSASDLAERLHAPQGLGIDPDHRAFGRTRDPNAGPPDGDLAGRL